MIRTALIIAALAIPAHAAEVESDYRNRLCAGWAQEQPIEDGTRPDCETARLAIEVDWSHKWHEAIGQALNYAAVTRKHPAIILVCKRARNVAKAEARCANHLQHIATAGRLISVPLIVWACGPDAMKLEQCKRHEFGGVQR